MLKKFGSAKSRMAKFETRIHEKYDKAFFSLFFLYMLLFHILSFLPLYEEIKHEILLCCVY